LEIFELSEMSNVGISWKEILNYFAKKESHKFTQRLHLKMIL
jgi:hypothetical protein